VVVLEPRGFRATLFDILNDIDAGELLEIAADDTLIVAQVISKGANRTGVVVLQVVDQIEATVVEDILSSFTSEDERIREAMLRQRLRERTAELQSRIYFGLLGFEFVRVGDRGVTVFKFRHYSILLTVVRIATVKKASFIHQTRILDGDQ